MELADVVGDTKELDGGGPLSAPRTKRRSTCPSSSPKPTPPRPPVLCGGQVFTSSPPPQSPPPCEQLCAPELGGAPGRSPHWQLPGPGAETTCSDWPGPRPSRTRHGDHELPGGACPPFLPPSGHRPAHLCPDRTRGLRTSDPPRLGGAGPVLPGAPREGREVSSSRPGGGEQGPRRGGGAGGHRGPAVTPAGGTEDALGAGASQSSYGLPFPGLARARRQVHNHTQELENQLLDTPFEGSNLTAQTSQALIQSLAFKLNCTFPGLALSSSMLGPLPEARPPHSMQFPAELTQEACQVPIRELRLICIYFYTSFFFQDGSNSVLLNNYVLGAQLGRYHVRNLSKSINISFWHNRSLENYTLTCVFWKEGAGRDKWTWSSEGCRTEQASPGQVQCHCNHLSYFAVLMQLSSARLTAKQLASLTHISLVGCSVSIVASLLTILLHVHTRKQSDSMTRIHVNLHASVLLLNVTFLLSPVLAAPSVPKSACMGLAAILHYALLSCLTWMAIEGFNLYLLLLRVYNIYIRRYLLKLCAVGWGLPAVLVLLVLVVKSSVYGHCVIPLSTSQDNGTGFQNISLCWVRSAKVHGVLVMGYGGLTSLFNLVVLACALRALHRLRAREKAPGRRACRDAVTVLGLTMLLGTTWALAFFSFSVFLLSQLFLFTILNSFYGFFLFLWFCWQRCRGGEQAEVGPETEASSSSQMMH
ncbi:adhesion G-protein coupled receptor G5 [Tenrec ecaudatus]|uniref:adhesion G-protein coupled receptor G5 n=1 Tax=Tenrec ecaudatus TaxID=94439 RepID=UPI003F59A45B